MKDIEQRLIRAELEIKHLKETSNFLFWIVGILSGAIGVVYYYSR